MHQLFNKGSRQKSPCNNLLRIHLHSVSLSFLTSICKYTRVAYHNVLVLDCTYIGCFKIGFVALLLHIYFLHEVSYVSMIEDASKYFEYWSGKYGSSLYEGIEYGQAILNQNSWEPGFLLGKFFVFFF